MQDPLGFLQRPSSDPHNCETNLYGVEHQEKRHSKQLRVKWCDAHLSRHVPSTAHAKKQLHLLVNDAG